jgi:hypothetical protein
LINKAGRSRVFRFLLSALLMMPALLPAAAFAGGEACLGIVIEAETGAILDEGWAGRAHDTPYSEGNVTSWRVLQRCSNNQAACTSDQDCGAGDCVATCDCQADSTCELTGPVDGRRCLTTMTDCTTNADCPASAACVSYFGAPLPVAYSGTPACIVSNFEGGASGTFDSGSGDLSLSGSLRRRVFLGSTLAQPCPRCGNPDQEPMPGAEFVCEGGQFPGAACVVDAVHPWFGGTSYDCPPTTASALTGPGTVFPLRDLGTDSKITTAGIPCASFGFTANPLSPGSNPKCVDDVGGPVCASNADCKRCTGDLTVKCTAQGDCTGKGTCAEAPDHPITCGHWCHCGFCNGNGAACMQNADCSEGQTCQKGSGTGQQATAPQLKPNDCGTDGGICGTVETERCKSSTVGFCSIEPFRQCENNADCQNFNAGNCNFSGKPCFGPEISRSGSALPLGSYCAVEDKACSTNADCTIGGDSCVPDSTRSRLAALYCLPTTSSSAFNSVVGFAGPAAASVPTFAKVCRCSGSEAGCENVCGSASGCGNDIVEDGEQCDGGACCNGNCTLSSSAVICRAAAGSCDTAESCTGSSAACPADVLQSSSTTCRASAGICDVAELCSGTSPTCPGDGFAGTSTTCRSAAGICDAAESCSGSSASCPADSFSPTTKTCRASTGDCDVAESCEGTAATCPANAFEPNGEACDDANSCTNDDECVAGVCEGTPVVGCGGECGDGALDEGEACDDGNATFTAGEYCGVACVLIPCGKPTNSSGVPPKTSDALFVLRTAVGQATCSPRVCSVDGNQTIVASDALRVLRAAVGQSVSLDCPAQ